jgi:hypothetical protein
MLEPAERKLYLEALRPPPGYRLDRAVGTTYSVDLLSLLAVPLSFAQLDWADDRDGLLADPVSLLRSLREHAGRITLFCQAGRIAMPARRHPLFTYLEPMLVEATAPHAKGEFHAKTWLLRFVGEDALSVRYRFLNLSRNLTTDRSWDTVLTLEGDLQQRVNAIGDNHPLGEFIEALPGLARRPVPDATAKELAELAREARRVRWEPPDPFEKIAFFPLGIDGHRGLDLETEAASKLLIVSPFLTQAFLEEVAVAGENYLVSRQESLDELGTGALARFKKTWVLDDGADLEAQAASEEEPPIESAPAQTAGDAEREPAEDPRGLHAKLFVVERGWDVEVLTGSANATSAAFERNVEFLVQLTGKKSKVGLKALLGEGGTDGLLFGSLLQAYQPPTEPPPTNAAAAANEKAVEAARRALSRATLGLKAKPSTTDGLYDLELALSSKLELLATVQGRCWPSSLRAPEEWNAATLASEHALNFARLSLQQLTAFLCVELAAGEGEDRRVVRFALAVPLEGAPSDRLDQVLAAILAEPGQFLRFLTFLLQDDGAETVAADLIRPVDHGGAAERRPHPYMPLLEDLLRVASRSPERLREVHRLVEDLRKTPLGRKVLPQGFEEVWGAVWAASGVTT